MKISVDIKSCKECPNCLISSISDSLCDIIHQTCKLNNMSVKEFYHKNIISEFCPLKLENKKKKDKLKIDLITGVWKNFCTIEGYTKSWKSKPAEMKCKNCGINLETLTTNPALVFATGEVNKVVCDECANKFIDEYSKRDLEKERISMKSEKELMIQQIRDLGNYNENFYYNREKLEDKKIEDLHKIYDEYKAKKDKKDRIDAIVISEEDFKIDQYLIDDYDVIQDPKYLKCEEQIEEYFMDCGKEFLEADQDGAQDEAEVIIKIAQKYYNVTIKAEIGRECCDNCADVYYIEKIESVEWEEIEKPLPKDKIKFTYSFELNKDHKNFLDNFLRENNFKFVEKTNEN